MEQRCHWEPSSLKEGFSPGQHGHLQNPPSTSCQSHGAAARLPTGFVISHDLAKAGAHQEFGAQQEFPSCSWPAPPAAPGLWLHFTVVCWITGTACPAWLLPGQLPHCVNFHACQWGWSDTERELRSSQQQTGSITPCRCHLRGMGRCLPVPTDAQSTVLQEPQGFSRGAAAAEQLKWKAQMQLKNDLQRSSVPLLLLSLQTDGSGTEADSEFKAV